MSVNARLQLWSFGYVVIFIIIIICHHCHHKSCCSHGHHHHRDHNTDRKTKNWQFSTYPSEVLLRKILGLGDVALGLAAVSCVGCIPAD